MEYQTKVILSAQIARKLIQLGYNIIDIKPDKYNKDRTIFVFGFTDILTFTNDLQLLTKQYKTISTIK